MENVIEIQTTKGPFEVIAYNKKGIYTNKGTLILYPYLKVLSIIQGVMPRSLQELCGSWGIEVRP